RAILAGDDALDAHRALLHDAELAHGHVRVQLHLERRREVVVVPVEASHVVRTVVAAVPGPDAAVVDLPVQALLRVIGGEDGTYGLAGRDLAVLTEHRHEEVRRLRSTGAVLQPALHAQPVELAAVRGLRLPDDRDVVLRDARHHTRAAAETGVDV